MGLVFETEYAIGVAEEDPIAPDVTVVAGHGPVGPRSRPISSARVIAEYTVGEQVLYSMSETLDGFVVRVGTVASFVVGFAGERVECYPGPGTGPDVVSVLLSGTVTAFLWLLRGRAVLHGSVIVYRRRAIAFMGPSGSGKSTITALCCAAGAHFLSDDLVVLGPAGPAAGRDRESAKTVTCVGRASELRLRPGSVEAHRLWPGGIPARLTGDGRLAVTLPGPPPTPGDLWPIEAAVLLRDPIGAGGMHVKRLGGALAAAALMAESRIGGLRDVRLSRTLLSGASSVADRVPVFLAKVPKPWASDRAAGTGILSVVAAHTGGGGIRQ